MTAKENKLILRLIQVVYELARDNIEGKWGMDAKMAELKVISAMLGKEIED